MQCMQCMHAGCLPGWRRKWADLSTLTRARAGRHWPVPTTDAHGGVQLYGLYGCTVVFELITHSVPTVDQFLP